MGFLEVFWVFLYVFRGVPGFLEGVPGCSGFSRRCSVVFQVFHTVPGVPGCSRVFRGVPGCSGVPCSGVPVFLELLHAGNLTFYFVKYQQLGKCCSTAFI